MKQTGVRVTSPTEEINQRTGNLDTVSTIELVRLLNEEDLRVPGTVAELLPELAALVDVAADRVEAGGRVHYFGAGTSGRLGILDAAELKPTFGVGEEVVIAHQAGGPVAFVTAVEDAEDVEEPTDTHDVRPGDVVIGLAASGRTPYVGAALAAARALGVPTALVTSNPDAPLAALADHLLVANTGPEALTGSTRLKAGSAQKLILNTFSTALMVRLGHTYGNLMVDLQATNAKLRGRSLEIVAQATGAGPADAAAALDECGDIKTAVVYLLAREADHPAPTAARCRIALADSKGRVRQALTSLGISRN